MVLVLSTFVTVLYYSVTTFIKSISYKLLFWMIFTFPCNPKLIHQNVILRQPGVPKFHKSSPLRQP